MVYPKCARTRSAYVPVPYVRTGPFFLPRFFGAVAAALRISHFNAAAVTLPLRLPYGARLDALNATRQ